MKKRFIVSLLVSICLSSCASFSNDKTNNYLSFSNNYCSDVSINNDSNAVNNADIKTINGYLPNEVFSFYDVIDKQNDKYFVAINNDVPREVSFSGIKFFISKECSGTFYGIESKDSVFYLEIDETYRISAYMVAYDETNCVNSLHSFSLLQNRMDWSFFETDYFTQSDGGFIIPTKLGKCSLTLKISEYIYTAQIEVKPKEDKESRLYSISFQTDENFKGTSVASPFFSDGDTIKIYRSDAVINSHNYFDSNFNEVLSFNGLRVGSTDTFVLPPMDLVVDFYLYNGHPAFGDYFQY